MRDTQIANKELIERQEADRNRAARLAAEAAGGGVTPPSSFTTIDATARAAAAAAQATANAAVPETRLLNSYQMDADITLTAGDVGLGNVANLAPADLPISTATAAALATKVETTDARLSDSRTPIVKQVEIDFGATPLESKSFTITDAAIVVGSKILASIAYVATTDHELDEVGAECFDLKCAPGVGVMTVFATPSVGLAHGKYYLNYTASVI
jgi:hypothetical protein